MFFSSLDDLEEHFRTNRIMSFGLEVFFALVMKMMGGGGVSVGAGGGRVVTTKKE